jgi:hypothetical protein
LPPDQRAQYLKFITAEMMSEQHRQESANPEERLFVTLKPEEAMCLTSLWFRAEHPGQKRTLESAVTPLCDGLGLYLIYDLGGSVRYVTAADLEKWKLDPSQAYEIAIANLRAITSRPPQRIVGPLYGSQTNDSYDAARAILSDWVDQAPIDGEKFVAIPVRDCLLIGGSSDVPRLLSEAQHRSETGAYPISHRIFRSRGGRLEPVPLSNGPLQEADLRDRLTSYQELKRVLDKIHENEKIDIFVASYTGVKTKDGQFSSYAVWTQGVHTYLPKTASIVFVIPEPQQVFQVPWERAAAVVGRLMHPVPEIKPALFEVKDFPSAAELAQLQAP